MKIIKEISREPVIFLAFNVFILGSMTPITLLFNKPVPQENFSEIITLFCVCFSSVIVILANAIYSLRRYKPGTGKIAIDYSSDGSRKDEHVFYSTIGCRNIKCKYWRLIDREQIAPPGEILKFRYTIEWWGEPDPVN